MTTITRGALMKPEARDKGWALTYFLVCVVAALASALISVTIDSGLFWH
jgi:hypothetical protein